MARRTVDWDAYAKAYDVMADNNPAYQDLLARLRPRAAAWPLNDGDVVVDLGAGTGNFSVALAALFPRGHVLHVDSAAAMNARACDKAAAAGLTNLAILNEDAERVAFAPGSVAAVVCVHALYTFIEPADVLRRIYRWLRPGGHFFACDLGRLMDVRDWGSYLFHESRKTRGLWRTARTFWRGRVVAGQNRHIARLQRRGRYWLHTHDEFVAAIERAGFRVEHSCEVYRRYSDLVCARKP